MSHKLGSMNTNRMACLCNVMHIQYYIYLLCTFGTLLSYIREHTGLYPFKMLFERNVVLKIELPTVQSIRRRATTKTK